MPDIRDLLRGAAPRPGSGPDLAAIESRVTRRRRLRQGAVATSVAAVVAALVVAVSLSGSPFREQVKEGGRPDRTGISTRVPSTTVPSTTVPSTAVPSSAVPSTTGPAPAATMPAPTTTVPGATPPGVTPQIPSTSVPPTTVPPTTPPTRNLPGVWPCDAQMPNGNSAVVGPSTGSFIACGSSALKLSQFTWQTWTATRATGTAVYAVNNCQPDCARGAFTDYSASVTLSNPRYLNGLFVFSTITITPNDQYHGQPITADVPGWGWVS